MVAALALGSVLSACTKQPGTGKGGLTGGESVFNITLDAGSFAGVPIDGGEMDGTVSKTIPATGMREDDMANIWVLQFDAEGTCVRSWYYDSYDPDDFPVTLSSGTAQTVAFVANTFDENLFRDYAGNRETFLALTREMTETTVHTGNDADHRYLVITGLYRGDIVPAESPFVVSMKRTVAKIRFTWSAAVPQGESFVPRSLQLHNAPENGTYFGQTAERYPAADPANFAEYAAIADPAAGTYGWYVAENTRGTGTGSTSFGKNASTAPDGQGDYCTYIDLQGEYTFKDGQKADLSYKFYLGANTTSDYNVRRNNIYDLTVRITGASAADMRLSLASAGGKLGVEDEKANAADEPAQDASFGVASPANCFMVVPGSSVTFDPRIQGNGGAGAQPIAPKSMGVLWQEGDGVNPLIRNVAFAPSQATVYVSSKIARGGNAVVAAYSGENCTGDILWSWHIWVTDYRPDGMKDYGLGENSYAAVDGGQVHTYGSEFMTAVKAVTPTRNRVIMDRNLGAAKAYYIPPQANDSEAPLAFGLAYQWGRKDPFPQWDGTNATILSARKLYSADGSTILTEDQTGYKKINITTEGVITDNNTLIFTIKNPLTFIYNLSTFDWYSLSREYDNDILWGEGTKKSIYDPCPAGWRVAPNGTWNDFGNAPYADPFYYYVNGIQQTEMNTPPIESHSTNGRYYKPGSGQIRTWYAASGGYQRNDGLLAWGGESGYVWSSSIEHISNVYGYYLIFGTNSVDPNYTTYRAHAYEVRCIQE